MRIKVKERVCIIKRVRVTLDLVDLTVFINPGDRPVFLNVDHLGVKTSLGDPDCSGVGHASSGSLGRSWGALFIIRENYIGKDTHEYNYKKNDEDKGRPVGFWCWFVHEDSKLY